MADYQAFREMLACANPDLGPVMKVSSFLGAGDVGGGAYAGHAELYDLDGILRESYQQASLEPNVNETLFGGGKGFNLTATTMSTLGEAIERTVAALVSGSPHLPGRRLLGTYEEMLADGNAAIDPETIGLFSDEQRKARGFLYEKFTRTSRIQWIEARRVVSGDAVWVPGQLLDMVHIYDPGEALVGYPVSGGLSCHSSFENALYHGMTEVIERDAVNLSWYTDAAPMRVTVENCPDRRLQAFFDGLDLNGGDTALLYHPSSISSALTFSVIGLQTWLQRRRYCAGGGCDVFGPAALRKAAAEYGQTRGTIGLSVTNPHSGVGRSVEEMFDWEYGRSLTEMTLFFQAIGFYGLPEYADQLDHYLSGPEVRFSDLVDDADFSRETTVHERLTSLLGELAGHGIDPIVLDYSHPQWRRLSIVKVWIPEVTTPFLQSRPMLGHPLLSKLRDGLVQPNGWVMPLPYP
jgi:ribosomal protein S12 methylthiotransferase accessory factor